MRNFWMGFGFAVFTLLAIIAVVTSIGTFVYHDSQTTGFFSFLSANHLWIMIFTTLIAVVYGFSWAAFLTQRVQKEKKTSKHVLSIVLSFLGKEESAIIQHLVEKKGISTQADISRIHNMGAVKALRTVQKMQEKDLLVIHKHGKVRKVVLKESIKNILTN